MFSHRFFIERFDRTAGKSDCRIQRARQSIDLHENEINGNQPGDPEKLAAVLIKIAADVNPPLHLFLGQDAYNMAKAKIAAVQKDMKDWRELATSTDIENAKAA